MNNTKPDKDNIHYEAKCAQRHIRIVAQSILIVWSRHSHLSSNVHERGTKLIQGVIDTHAEHLTPTLHQSRVVPSGMFWLLCLIDASSKVRLVMAEEVLPTCGLTDVEIRNAIPYITSAMNAVRKTREVATAKPYIPRDQP